MSAKRFDDAQAVRVGSVPVHPEVLHDFAIGSRGRGAVDDVVPNWPPSLARQEFAAECDINTIMQRYQVTQQLPVNSRGEPVYLDLVGMPETLLETLQVLKTAEDAFMRLPAEIRREFDNDPVAFANFAVSGDNADQLRAWGLAKPVEVPDVTSGLIPEPPAPVTPVASPAPPKAP